MPHFMDLHDGFGSVTREEMRASQAAESQARWPVGVMHEPFDAIGECVAGPVRNATGAARVALQLVAGDGEREGADRRLDGHRPT